MLNNVSGFPTDIEALSMSLNKIESTIQTTLMPHFARSDKAKPTCDVRSYSGLIQWIWKRPIQSR